MDRHVGFVAFHRSFERCPISVGRSVSVVMFWSASATKYSTASRRVSAVAGLVVDQDFGHRRVDLGVEGE